VGVLRAEARTYLFGRTAVSERVYQVVSACSSSSGSVLTLGAVLDFAGAVLFLLAPVVKEEVEAFPAGRRNGDVVEMAPAERRTTTRS
jgi:alanine or glycine:cation symporter, AGCS family